MPRAKVFMVGLSAVDRDFLVKLTTSGTRPARMIMRARVLLELDENCGPVADRAVIADRVGASENTVAQFDPAVAAELRDRLVGSRRRLVRAIWDRGVARGELRPDTDPEAAIDLVFGPAMYRLVAGHAPLDDAAADAIIDAALRGLAL